MSQPAAEVLNHFKIEIIRDSCGLNSCGAQASRFTTGFTGANPSNLNFNVCYQVRPRRIKLLTKLAMAMVRLGILAPLH